MQKTTDEGSTSSRPSAGSAAAYGQSRYVACPPVSHAYDKGAALENAVRAIEHAILEAAPSLEKGTFRIDTKKILSVDGVRHEIDVFVQVDIGPGYDTTFIFECKNWTAKVGKNDIIVFSEKIAVSQAQRGFFVAKNFTADARAQADKDARMLLLTVKEYDPSGTAVPHNFHFIETLTSNINLDIAERGSARPPETTQVLLSDMKATLNGTRLDVDAYVSEWARELLEEKVRTFPSASKPTGEYEIEQRGQRSYGSGDLFISGREISTVTLIATGRIIVSRPPVVSHYDVESRGRIISLEEVTTTKGAKIAFKFIDRSVTS